MDIKNVAVSLTRLKPNSAKTNKALLNQPIEDKLTISRPSVEDAMNEVAKMKDMKKGGPRFSEKELQLFEKYYKEGKIDLEVVNRFKDRNSLEMKSIKEIYEMKHDTKDSGFYDKVSDLMDKYSEGKEITKFSQSIFKPKDEFSIKVVDLNEQNKIKSPDKTLTIDVDGNLVATSHRIVLPDKDDVSELNVITRTKDLKNNTESKKVEAVGQDKISYVKEYSLLKRDRDNNVIRKEEMKMSEIKGVYNITYTYPDGTKEEVSKASINPKTGIKTIKKDMKSSDGTRTEFLYEDDKSGNRIVDYKITDKNGKVLMKNSQTFEVVSDDKFISSKNHRKYEITTDEKGMKIKDLSHDRETSIDFKKKCKGNREELIKLLKKVPGEELFETVDSIKKLNGKNKDKLLESYFTPVGKKINIGDDLFVFLHELGHAKDGEYQKVKDVIFGKNNKVYQDDKNIQKVFLEERENFNKNHTDSEREMIDYFIQAKGHYQGEFGGLAEVIAETNALTNTHPSAEVKSLGDRTQLLQQHFPKTIAAIKDAMEYKNDLLALEYYGT